MTPPKVESPFVGLVPYTEDDAQFFFGRERDQQRILANLFASRLTILYGASGVGKSSVLRAGIVQEVRQRIAQARATGEPPEIAVVYFNEWKGDVLLPLRAAIGNALVSLLGKDYISTLPPSISLEDLLVAAGTRMGGDLLLILDQFEEYFLYHPGEEADEFAMQFARAANHSGIPANFLISLRDDAVSRLDRFKPLIPNLFSNYLRLHHLSGDDARDTILKPVQAYNALPEERKATPGNFTVEPDLVGMVIDQAHTGRVLIGQVGKGKVASTPAVIAVETPYLQLVMIRLWNEECRRASFTLRCATLRALGGAETIVKGHLEAALAGLSEAERDICAMVFPHLVTPSGTKIVHTVLNLARFAKVETGGVRPLLEKLAASDKRILAPVAPPDGQPGELQYEIYHDSLAQAVLSWQARYEAARERTVRVREKRRIVVIATVLFIALLIAAAGAVLAFSEWQIASTERVHARKAEAEAYALKSESDAMRLEKEKADAERNHNAALVAALSTQIQSAHSEATKFKKQAAATPGGDAKGPALADVMRERDALRNQIASLETNPPVAPTETKTAAPGPAQPRDKATAPHATTNPVLLGLTLLANNQVKEVRVKAIDQSGGAPASVNYSLSFITHGLSKLFNLDVKTRQESGPTCELTYRQLDVREAQLSKTSYCIYGTPFMFQLEFLVQSNFARDHATLNLLTRDAQCKLPQLVGAHCSPANEAAERARAGAGRKLVR